MFPEHLPIPAEEFSKMLDEARRGSVKTMGQLLMLHRDILSTMARSLIPAELAAKNAPSDLVQETLLGAYRGLAEFRGTSEGEFLKWLKQILLHTALDFVRAFRGRSMREIGREES